jgi:hypothetical protein
MSYFSSIFVLSFFVSCIRFPFLSFLIIIPSDPSSFLGFLFLLTFSFTPYLQFTFRPFPFLVSFCQFHFFYHILHFAHSLPPLRASFIILFSWPFLPSPADHSFTFSYIRNQHPWHGKRVRIQLVRPVDFDKTKIKEQDT